MQITNSNSVANSGALGAQQQQSQGQQPQQTNTILNGFSYQKAGVGGLLGGPNQKSIQQSPQKMMGGSTSQ